PVRFGKTLRPSSTPWSPWASPLREPLPPAPHGLNTIQRRVFATQVSQQRLVAERSPRDAPAQFGGPVALALPVGRLVKPAPPTPQIPSAELGVEVTQVLPRLLHELSGVQVAQRVRREVADAAEAPVDVLQAPLRVVGRRQAQHFPELRGPRRR